MLGLGTDISVDLIIAQKCLRKKKFIHEVKAFISI